MSGKLVIISGPSGVGKDTVAGLLRQRNSRVAVIVSYTTRSPRGEEEEGVDYRFVSLEQFLKLAQQGELLEFQDVNRSFYATPLAAVRKELADGRTVILVIDVMGMLMALDKHPEAITIFLRAPSSAILEERLRKRESTSFEAKHNQSLAESSHELQGEFEDNVLRRMLRAVAEESLSSHYRHVVINDDLESTVAKVSELIQ